MDDRAHSFFFIKKKSVGRAVGLAEKRRTGRAVRFERAYPSSLLRLKDWAFFVTTICVQDL
jgi:hypothetical protein